MRKSYVLYIVLGASLLLSGILTLALFLNGMFNDFKGVFHPNLLISFAVFFFVLFMEIASITVSNKFASGKFQEILFILASILLISEILGYIVFSLIECKFQFAQIDWLGSLINMPSSGIYFGVLAGFFVGITLLYIFVINKNFISVFTSKSGTSAKQIKNANLENSRWLNEKEKKQLKRK